MSNPRLFKTRSVFSATKGNLLQESQLHSSFCLGPLTAQPFQSHTNPRAPQDGEGPQTCFFLPISPLAIPWHKILFIYQKKKNAVLCSWIARNEHAAKITGTVQHHRRRQPASVRESVLQTERDVLPRITWRLLARLPIMGFPKWFPKAPPLSSELRKKPLILFKDIHSIPILKCLWMQFSINCKHRFLTMWTFYFDLSSIFLETEGIKDWSNFVSVLPCQRSFSSKCILLDPCVSDEINWS